MENNVLVTGCSSYGSRNGRNYFDGLLTLLKSVNIFANNIIDEILVFDFDLEIEHVKQLKRLNNNRIKIKYIPEDVRNIEVTPFKYYLFKSYLMANISNYTEQNNNILFLDAGVCFIDNPKEIFDIIGNYGLFVVEHDDQITRPWVTEEIINNMHATNEELDSKTSFCGIVGWKLNYYNNNLFKEIFDYMNIKEIKDSLRYTQGKGKLEQSIFSILFDRYNIEKQNHRKFAEHLGIKTRPDQILYVHRCGNFDMINNYFSKVNQSDIL